MPITDPQVFFDVLNVTKLRVTRPIKFIFLCGGPLNAERAVPLSARESFLRGQDDRLKFNDHKIVLAEQIDAFYPDSPYRNLIEFEIDIARISDAVILFSEGFGSLAELGAFSQIDAIAERMMVVIQSHHHGKKSFIRDGPVRHLEDRDSESVQVFDWCTVRNGDQTEIDTVSFERHFPDIVYAIARRLSGMPNQTRLNLGDFGHKIMMASAVCDTLGAVTFSELKSSFERLGIQSTQNELERMLFCAIAVGWIEKQKRGNTKYYLPKFGAHSCIFAYNEQAIHNDTARWQIDIRAYWRKNDTRRFKLITDHKRGEHKHGF